MNPDPAPFSVAIAGFGRWGKHIATRLEGHPFLHVAGIVEPMDTGHAAIREMGFPVWTGLAAPLASADVDAVILTTPDPLLEEQVVQCARAGKHVFCEQRSG